jgi:hypothetical protein
LDFSVEASEAACGVILEVSEEFSVWGDDPGVELDAVTGVSSADRSFGTGGWLRITAELRLGLDRQVHFLLSPRERR